MAVTKAVISICYSLFRAATSWVPTSWLRWIPTSEDLLAAAERKILSCKSCNLWRGWTGKVDPVLRTSEHQTQRAALHRFAVFLPFLSLQSWKSGEIFSTVQLKDIVRVLVLYFLALFCWSFFQLLWEQELLKLFFLGEFWGYAVILRLWKNRLFTVFGEVFGLIAARTYWCSSIAKVEFVKFVQ